MTKCKLCKTSFTRKMPMQLVCSPDCAIALAKIKNEKAKSAEKLADRRETKKRLKAIKPRSEYLKEAQAIANRYARVRDAKDGCISCDKPASWHGQWHGSHFRSVGAASAVRFNLWNINKACSVCNNHLSGNIAEYLPRLIEKIGIEKVEWLQSQNQLVRHDIEYLEKYKRVIGKRLKRMENKKHKF